MLRIILIVGLVLSGVIFSNLQAQEPLPKILELKEKIIDLQNQADLGINNIMACSRIVAYGTYTPLEGPKIKKGERLLVYLEPVNFFTKRTNGKYEIFLTEDILILNEKGDILWGREGASTYNYTSNSPVIDLFFVNAVDIKDLPPGKYVFKAIINDKLKGKSAFKSIFFEIVG